jgi:Tfp pilus assembly protein PilF
MSAVSAPARLRSAIPQISVPLDELLKIAAEFSDSGRFAEAERLLDHILSAIPDSPGALHLRGLVLFHTGRTEAAAELIERAVQLAPGNLMFRRNLCPIYERLCRYDDALRVGRQALDGDALDLQTLHNLALVHYRRLELDECIAYARRALALDPSTPTPHFQLAEALLLRGDFAEGWREYEWRYRTPGAAAPLPPTNRPQWDGAPLASGTLLLIADQGFGDAIQFCRYIPWVRERCRDIVVAVSPELHPLLRQVDANVQLFDRWDRCPDFSAYCPLSGLPRLHGTTLASIPSRVPYLWADPRRKAAWRARMKELLQPGFCRIGIAWAGRPTHVNDGNRSAGLAAFAPIAELDGVALISLQKGSAQSAIAEYFRCAPLLNLGAVIGDFMDTMAILENLDLIVTVDTSLAHLAGAMGKPVWILLPYAPDWRWLVGRSDSPWYPTARLFRQARPGDWVGVGHEVRAALRRMLEQRSVAPKGLFPREPEIIP